MAERTSRSGEQRRSVRKTPRIIGGLSLCAVVILGYDGYQGYQALTSSSDSLSVAQAPPLAPNSTEITGLATGLAGQIIDDYNLGSVFRLTRPTDIHEGGKDLSAFIPVPGGEVNMTVRSATVAPVGEPDPRQIIDVNVALYKNGGSATTYDFRRANAHQNTWIVTETSPAADGKSSNVTAVQTIDGTPITSTWIAIEGSPVSRSSNPATAANTVQGDLNAAWQDVDQATQRVDNPPRPPMAV